MEKPDDNREMDCHSSAFDMFSTNDVRIKMCTQINMDDFLIAHHEMGHIQYFLQYQKLPFIFREAANAGFHEAVGDTIALSVATPKHLEKIGLLKEYVFDNEALINQLFKIVKKLNF